MADDHGIVAVGVELAPRGVGDGHILESDSRLEGEGGDSGDLLLRNQGSKRVLRLRLGSFLQVFSHRSSHLMFERACVFIVGRDRRVVQDIERHVGVEEHFESLDS